MQKTSKKASILIWATFLSLIMTVIFVSISTNINKNLKNNLSLTEEFKNENEIKNLLNSWSINMNYNDLYLKNWDKIIFEKSNKTTISLKKWEIHTWKININSNITIDIKEWWPVTYKSNNYNDIITDKKTFWWITNKYFYIKNLWWYSKIIISSDTTWNYLSKYRNYNIYKKIWNKEVIKWSWKIKNFD